MWQPLAQGHSASQPAARTQPSEETTFRLQAFSPREGALLPAEEEVEDDFKGKSGDDFQSLKNINVPVPTKPQPLLPGSIFLCSLGGTPGSLFIMISLYFGGTQLVYPEKMKNTA